MSLAGRLAATAPSRPVGLARIAVGAAATWDGIRMIPRLEALLRPHIVELPLVSWIPRLPPSGARVFAAAWIVAALAFAIGWRTMIAGMVLAGCMSYALLLDQQLYSNHLYLLVLEVTLLVLARGGTAVSLDAGRAGNVLRVPAWPVTLLKVQVTIVYGFAALQKINRPYLRGHVLAGNADIVGPWVFPQMLDRPAILVPLAVISIAVEGSLAVALWWGRTRRVAAVAGVAFHAGILLVLGAGLYNAMALAFFGLVMIALYPLFFDEVIDLRAAAAVARPVLRLPVTRELASLRSAYRASRAQERSARL